MSKESCQLGGWGRGYEENRLLLANVTVILVVGLEDSCLYDEEFEEEVRRTSDGYHVVRRDDVNGDDVIEAKISYTTCLSVRELVLV